MPQHLGTFTKAWRIRQTNLLLLNPLQVLNTNQKEFSGHLNDVISEAFSGRPWLVASNAAEQVAGDLKVMAADGVRLQDGDGADGVLHPDVPALLNHHCEIEIVQACQCTTNPAKQASTELITIF